MNTDSAACVCTFWNFINPEKSRRYFRDFHNPIFLIWFQVLRSEIPSGMCAKLHTVAASDNRDHPTRSLCYCLFASRIYGCCSSRTFRSWWTTHSAQRQRRGCNSSNQWRTQKLFMGGFIQWHRGVICIWCALFVTSQNVDIICKRWFGNIVLFPNQRFGEVCWHNMHIFLYIHSSYFMCQCTEHKLLELQVRLSEENTYTQRYDTAVRNCKIIRRCVKTREYNTLINSSEQFTAEKWGCANVLLNTSSRA